MGILTNLYLTTELGCSNRIIIRLAIGLIVYPGYGYHKSKPAAVKTGAIHIKE
jgi:hypothetical protein